MISDVEPFNEPASLGGSLVKIGTGTLTLAGPGVNNYTGTTTVRAGALQVDGSIKSNTFVNAHGTLAGTGTINGNLNNQGTVAPAEQSDEFAAPEMPGTLTINGDYTQRAGGLLLIDLAGTGSGLFSLLDVSGLADLNGRLDPVLLNGFLPSVGDSFTFLTAGDLTGAFSVIQHPIFNDGSEEWNLIYGPNSVTLTVEAHVSDSAATWLLLTLGLVVIAAHLRLSRAGLV